VRGYSVYLHGATFFFLLQTHFLEVLRAHGLGFSKSDLPLTYDRLTYHPDTAQIDDGQGHTVLARFDWG
jgi:hypothetical protein